MAKNESALMAKLRKNSCIKESATLDKSILYKEKTISPTAIKSINIALSGSPNGGLSSGTLTIAGPSKHFKSLCGLVACAAYLKKHKDGIMLFYDSEFGTPDSYFEAVGIDRSRVIHTPVKTIEELKFDLIKQLDGIERGDKVVIFLDSIGNLASKKELEDALNEKSVADMTRAKAVKSLFRMVTPYLTLKDLPFITIAHTYASMEMYSKQVVSSGTGLIYSSDNVWIMGRQQEKDGKEVIGYNFIINVEKSRYVKEKSKIPVCVTYDGGISKWSGLIDMAVELGYVYKPKVGWYQARNPIGLKEVPKGEEYEDVNGHLDLHEKNFRLVDTNTNEFWDPVFNDTDFVKAIEKRYTLGTITLVEEDNEVKILEEDEILEEEV